MATIAQTPTRKGVRWAFDVANSPFGGAAEPSTPETSTSSLAYVNSQIIAHGFARAPLELSELGREEQNKVVKCVLGMLSQRVDDMTRAEDLSTRLRNLSYEHERLSNMLRASKTEVLQAEREAEAARTKNNLLTKDLTTANTAHNRTSAQLAQTTSAIAALRAASTADARKREQELAKLKERWQKLSGEQAKLGTVGSGMVCTNWAVAVNEQYVGMRGEGEEAVEGAMRDAVEARERLAEENDEFREVLVKLVGVVGEGLKAKEVQDVKLPTPSSLFTPPTIEDDAGPALNAYRALRDLVQQLAATSATTSPEVESAAREAERAKAEAHRTEIRSWEEKTEKLERDIARLMGELAASNDFAEKSRLLIEQMANDKRTLQQNAEENAAGEAATLAEERQQLEEERAKFTDAAIRLARERSEFEVERLELAEEKRQWATRQLEQPEPPALHPEVPAPLPERSPSPPSVIISAPPKVSPKHNGVLTRSASKASGSGLAKENGVESAPTKAETVSKSSKGAGSSEPGLTNKLRTALKAAAAAESSDSREKSKKASTSRDKTKPKAGERKKPPAKKERRAPPPAVQAPTTPRSLHPAAQRAKARNYAPAVPSPLSRILSMAESPEARLDVVPEEVEEVVRLPRKSPLRTSGTKSPLRRSPRTATSSLGGSLAEKFAAAAAKGKGKEREREQEEKDKDEGKDLEIILAAPKVAESSRAPRAGPGPSRLPVGKPMRVAVGAPKRGVTPRKAAVGVTRAKRGWRG